ncbi:MAG: virulence RhuM family protein [Fibromonadales bacterium]|nr:virulence RhuM family protein [Fibromonadales bacterium]
MEQTQKENKGEIVLYQAEDMVKLDVLLENETVWLTQAQMGQLFEKSRNTITEHIQNVFKEGELQEEMVCRDFRHTTQHGAIEGKTQVATTKYYNLDVIISVGYRVKSKKGTQFRIWATQVLKNYLLKGYAIRQQIESIKKISNNHESRLIEVEKKIDVFIKTSAMPLEGIFYDGQIFDAYTFVCNLVKSAKKSIILIDNWVDESVLTLLSKRKDKVSTEIYTPKISQQFQLDITKHNSQYPPINVKIYQKAHDRFLLIDENTYHIGASIKDLGKKLFAFSKMQIKASDLLESLH